MFCYFVVCIFIRVKFNPPPGNGRYIMPTHILDLQWNYRWTFGLDDEAIFWYKGYGYYCGCEHDDGEARKTSHLVRDPCDMIFDVDGPSAYRGMTFAEFKEVIDDDFH